MTRYEINTVQDFNDLFGIETLHPLVSVVRYEHPQPILDTRQYHYGVYALFLKENKCCKLSYGRTEYDFDEMTITSFAPGQTITAEPAPDTTDHPKWTAIVFHPDLLARTQLGAEMSRYEFFSYNSNEALHLSLAEVELFRNVLNMIKAELERAIDEHTRELIVSHISLLLNYCLRFYDRQFITRHELNHSVIIKFDTLLHDYIQNRAQTQGLPTVAYFADKCCLSNGYFGELVKKETGHTAQEFISAQVLTAAKQLLDNHELNISQICDQLGFEYPQHFVRFFKRHTGKTPSQYRTAG